MKSGIFRYIRHKDRSLKESQGWRFAADLGEYHGQWSVLMWWCCGACREDNSEVPKE